MASTIRTHNLGYPRIGEKRELKKSTEAFWRGTLTLEELQTIASELRRKNWKTQQAAGIDLIPSNDFSFYDAMLDMSCLLGNVPARFNWKGGVVGLETLFLMARGPSEAHALEMNGNSQVTASEMTKWFDTNYHYIVPEFDQNSTFKLSSNKPFDEFQEALDIGILTKPVLIGPVSFLSLGKVIDAENPDFDQLALLDRLLPVYTEILQKLADQGAKWVQMDEPIFALDLSQAQKAALKRSYDTLSQAVPSLKIMVAQYFGELRDNKDAFLSLPVDCLHIDAERGAAELDEILGAFPSDKTLSLGVVNGRNIWKNDFAKSLDKLRAAHTAVGSECLIVSPSCSLLHSPITLRNEKKLDDELKTWLAFAEEKLEEVNTLRDLLESQDAASDSRYTDNQQAMESRSNSKRIHHTAVKERLAGVKPGDMDRKSPFDQRCQAQRERLKLPLFPTTTIGSFPQTKAVRSNRAKLKRGLITEAEYETFVEQQIEETIRFQEKVGIDVLVHGEFERNDMVEYFGEELEGFAFTEYAWVQSYGSRYVKPPIIYGDVFRPNPMTVRWSKYAQSLTDKPMKGMLTGPITILQWSFVRDDQPRRDTANQIALAIRDEATDLEEAGIAAVQIDEPALREGLPLRKADWEDYCEWAVNAFRLCASGVRDDTQIHTHMCYCEFNDIIESIARLDADVISIETSRSKMELLDAFVDFQYPNEIGPGVYDIHSPRIPTEEEMVELLKKAREVLPAERIWVNPDCGLKTRQWDEVKPALFHMTRAAQAMREN